MSENVTMKTLAESFNMSDFVTNIHNSQTAKEYIASDYFDRSRYSFFRDDESDLDFLETKEFESFSSYSDIASLASIWNSLKDCNRSYVDSLFKPNGVSGLDLPLETKALVCFDDIEEDVELLYPSDYDYKGYLGRFAKTPLIVISKDIKRPFEFPIGFFVDLIQVVMNHHGRKDNTSVHLLRVEIELGLMLAIPQYVLKHRWALRQAARRATR